MEQNHEAVNFTRPLESSSRIHRCREFSETGSISSADFPLPFSYRERYSRTFELITRPPLFGGNRGKKWALTSDARAPVRGVHLPIAVPYESGAFLEILGSPFLQSRRDQGQLSLLRATGWSGCRRSRTESEISVKKPNVLILFPFFSLLSFDHSLDWVVDK